jgi:hypothetical protein
VTVPPVMLESVRIMELLSNKPLLSSTFKRY